MRILEQIEKIADFGQSRIELQKEITTIEAWHLWDYVVSRYDIIETTQVLKNFARDPDLKVVLAQGIKALNQQVQQLEELMSTYGIPLPNRPPATSDSPLNVEVLTDEYIFRRVLGGIQNYIPSHAMAMIHATSPKLREEFMTFLLEEIKMYDKFLVYGQFKGWTTEPPAYRV
ncbi:MAG: hypothetical protein VR69_12280 [Peptococcaceae bacterium BRH_c4b]|nr:MAG: hypothetical protein VR69_12280 [Peptococcaceae bacterium BRH_c4b]